MKNWVFFLKTKDEVFGKFKEWKALFEDQTSRQFKILRTNNGLELCGDEFNQFCEIIAF